MTSTPFGLVSGGVLWLLIGLNTLLTILLARVLHRVRARWSPSAADAPGAQPAGTAPPQALTEFGEPDSPAGRLLPRMGEAPPPEGRAARGTRPGAGAMGPGPGEYGRTVRRTERLGGVTVVIPTNDAPHLLHPCLRSLRQAQGNLRLEVLCVFSSDPGACREVCDRYGARVLRARGRFCFSRSVNIGLRQATQPLVLLLNNDVEFSQAGSLERLAAVLEENPQLAAVGPVSSNVGNELQCREGARPNGRLFDPRYALIGHCVLFRREMLESVGYFDEKFRAYGYDEVDWFWRARALGYRWAVDETVWVDHRGTATFTQAAVESGISVTRRRFIRKWGQDPHAPGAWDPPSPQVSIVMSARNCEPWLDRCLNSIRDAALPDYEVVCVDDDSFDGTFELLRRWAPLIPLKYARFSKAENVARAKNRALRMATGRYIALMDADDEMPADRVPALMAALRETGSDLAYGAFELRPGWEPRDATLVPACPWDLERYARTDVNWVCPCATLFRREILDRGLFFDESLPAYEDYAWILEIGRRGFRIHEASSVNCHVYHQRGQSTLRSYEWDMLRDGIRLKDRLAHGTPAGHPAAALK